MSKPQQEAAFASPILDSVRRAKVAILKLVRGSGSELYGLRCRLRAEAHRQATDYDVLLAYEIFLNREPESSYVIREKTDATVANLIREFVESREFRAVSDLAAQDEAEPGWSRKFSELTPEHLAWVDQAFMLTDLELAELKETPSRAKLLLMLKGDGRRRKRILRSVPH